MKYFLLKTEPEVYSIDDLKRDGQTRWDGIRNFQARNYLKEMQKGDMAFVYHTGGQKQIVGLAEICGKAYPELTKDKGGWLAVEISYKQTLSKLVSLAEIKQNPVLKDMKLVKNARLSVQPVEKAEFEEIMRLAGEK